MAIRTTLITSGLIAAGLVSGAAHAALQGRDLNGSPGSFEAYYDADRNLTWLADANYAQTSGYDADGRMNWGTANTWAAGLSFTDGVNTYAGWRLPAVVDTGAPGCDFAYSGTDCGYNVDTATGEMAHLFYDELGNKAYYDTSGNPQSGGGLTNAGPFSNLQDGGYWSGSEYAPAPGTSSAWYFNFNDGGQSADDKDYGSYYAWAVRPGDVAAVPLPAAAWLLGSGLLGLIGVARRRG